MSARDAYRTLTWSKIELDGTGLSGANCDRKVLRRQPFVSGHPELGMTRRAEWCGELARWQANQLVDDRRPALCHRHYRDVTSPPRGTKKPSKALEQYRHAGIQDQTAAQAMAGRQQLQRLLAAPGSPADSRAATPDDGA